ncbi:MAG: DUF86 domain-containing protein [Candidatus Altiarchaeota archaeon]
MKRDNRLYLQDILESIKAIDDYTKDLSEGDFKKDMKVQDAVARRIEIIGEAVKNISDDLKSENSEVPWKDIAGMRDIIAHAYFGVNIKRIWNVLENELPRLKDQISAVLENADG